MSRRESSNLRFHQVWVFIGWTMVCLIIYLSLTTTGSVVVGGFFNDKVSHTLGYFCLMLWFMQLYTGKGTRLLYALLFVAMGIGLEYLQGLGGVRVFELADMMANTSGIVLGWLAATLGMDRLLLWFESRVLKKS